MKEFGLAIATLLIIFTMCILIHSLVDDYTFFEDKYKYCVQNHRMYEEVRRCIDYNVDQFFTEELKIKGD